MSNIKIKDTMSADHVHIVQEGQYYKDISPHGNEAVYIVAKYYVNSGCLHTGNGSTVAAYCLTSVVTGRQYSCITSLTPSDVFGDDENDFVYVPNVTITLS